MVWVLDHGMIILLIVLSDQSAGQITLDHHLSFNINVYIKWIFLCDTTYFCSWLSASIYANCIDLKYLENVLVNNKGRKKSSIERVHHKYATHFMV